MPFKEYLLSLAIWVPIAFGVAVLTMGDDKRPMPARWTALVGSVLGFLVCVPLWTRFEPQAAMQFVESARLHPEDRGALTQVELGNVSFELVHQQ